MSAIHARKKPLLRLATVAVAMIATLGMTACSGDAFIPSSSLSSTQVGDRSPKQIKEADEIIIDVFSSRALFGHIDADGRSAGYDIVYGDRIAVNLGVTAKYVLVDAAVHTGVLVSNKVSITLASFTVTPERAKKVDFANPYFKVSLGAISPISTEITDVGQLAGKALIVTKGTTVEAYFETNHPEVKLQKYGQYSGAYQVLEDGRGNAFPTDNTEVITRVIQHPGFSVGIKSLGKASYITAIVRKGSAALLGWLNNQLIKLGQGNFFHKDYEQTLILVYSDAVALDDLVVGGGVDTTSTN